MKETIPGTIQRRKVNLKIILANIFSAVKAHGKKEVWNHIAIGSDFDGMIVPFETYANSAQLDDLAQDLYQFLSKPAPIFDLFTEEELKKLMFGLTAEQIVKKIMSENAIAFTLRNLPD
jgi:microsomal dipeptidase-like Zn-dependent dipeptidase